MNEYSIFTKIDMTTNNIELGKTSYALDDLRTYLIPSISLWQQQYIWSFNLTNSFLKPINIEVNLIYKSWFGVGGSRYPELSMRELSILCVFRFIWSIHFRWCLTSSR